MNNTPWEHNRSILQLGMSHFFLQTMPRLTLALAFLAASSSGAIAAAYNTEANDAAALFLRGGESSNVDAALFAKLQNDEVRVTALRPRFLEWVKEHSRVYESVEEEMRRMLVWIENHGERVARCGLCDWIAVARHTKDQQRRSWIADTSSEFLVQEPEFSRAPEAFRCRDGHKIPYVDSDDTREAPMQLMGRNFGYAHFPTHHLVEESNHQPLAPIFVHFPCSIVLPVQP